MTSKRNEPLTMQQFSETFYDPEKTDPAARAVSFNVLIDFGGFTRRVVRKKGWDYNEITDTAKRGKCLAREQGKR